MAKKLKEHFTNGDPITGGRFLTAYVPVILTLLFALVAGITAWAQVEGDIENLEERQSKVEHTLENIRTTQSQHGAQLRGLAEQNNALTMAQQRIYDSLTRLHRRLDDTE